MKDGKPCAELAIEFAQDTLVGVVSGGFFGGTGHVISSVQTAAKDRKTGRMLNAGGGNIPTTIVNAGLKRAVGTESHKLAQRLLDAVVEFFQRLKAALGGDKTAFSKAVQQQFGTDVMGVEEAIRLWQEALDKAKTVAQTAQQEGIKNTAQRDGAVRKSINSGFASSILAWDGRENKTFTLGTTSTALQSIGICDSKIILHSKKARNILENPKHSMTKELLARVPEVLEAPIAILKSQQVTDDNIKYNNGTTSRLVIFGELNDANGVPVAVILELMPLAGGKTMELSVVASAYGKTEHMSGFVQSSDVLYLDPNKNRTNAWLKSLRVTFPLGTTKLGSLGMVTYDNGKVNIEGVPFSDLSGAKYVSTSQEVPVMQEWQKKLMDLGDKLAAQENKNRKSSKGGSVMDEAVTRLEELIEEYGAIPEGENPFRRWHWRNWQEKLLRTEKKWSR